TTCSSSRKQPDPFSGEGTETPPLSLAARQAARENRHASPLFLRRASRETPQVNSLRRSLQDEGALFCLLDLHETRRRHTQDQAAPTRE
uniref:Uncharacterized protein n=1 Tax=Salvator merianae TaxID=96440 RepID=A0A8D0BIV4_SALMN